MPLEIFTILMGIRIEEFRKNLGGLAWEGAHG
jgi:hypothetical protein